MKKILVVDDSATSRLLFKAHMPKGGRYEVHEADSLESALEKAAEVRPDIVVLDFNMPEKNGVEIADQLTNDGIVAKFVLLTANIQKSVIDSADSAGFVTVVEKPITAEKLVNMLEELA